MHPFLRSLGDIFLRIGTPFENAVSETDRYSLSVLDGIRHLSVLRLWQEEGEDAGSEGSHAEDDDGERGVDDLKNQELVYNEPIRA